jgi:hypothetical protein
MTDHGIKRLLSGRELEEEILTSGESNLLMERGQVNDMKSARTNEGAEENKTNEEESTIFDITENLPTSMRHLETWKNKFNLPDRIEYTSRSPLHRKDTRDVLTDKQVSESGALNERIVDDDNMKEFDVDSLENVKYVHSVTDVLLPKKLSTIYIVRKAENISDYPVQTDAVSDIVMQNDAKVAALTPSYSMSLAEKQGSALPYHETQGNRVSDGEIESRTISYDEVEGTSAISSETQSGAVSRDEIQVNRMPLGDIKGTTMPRAETQDNAISYSETQWHTTDFNEAQGNTLFYSETQSSTVNIETVSNTKSQSEAQDNISSGSTTKSNPVAESTIQNTILPDEVTKRETKRSKIRRESRFLVAQMSNIHNVRDMESLFNIMTPKEEITESKSSSTVNAQPAIKANASLSSNTDPLKQKQDALEIEFPAANSDLDVHSTLMDHLMAPSFSVNYNINDLSTAKSLVLTGQNEQSLGYMKHGNEDDEETKILEPKSNIEAAGIFIKNIKSSMSLSENDDSESTSLFAERSESLPAHSSSHSLAESLHSPSTYQANVTSSLTFNCKM